MPKYFAAEEYDEFAAWIDRPVDGLYFVAEHVGQIIACGGVYMNAAENAAGLAWGMVDPDFQGQGIGRRLTQFRVSVLKSNYSQYDLLVSTSQHTVGFYEQMGYRTVKVIPNGFAEGLDKYEMIME